MPAKMLRGRPLVAGLTEQIREQVRAFRKLHGQAPVLSVIRVGHEPTTISYTRQLDRAFTAAGLGFQLQVFEPDTPPARVQDQLWELEHDPNVHGIMIQRPLPPQLDGDALMRSVPVWKDVEGVGPANLGQLVQNHEGYFTTTTPSAGLELLDFYGIPLAGKHAVVVGRSNILGRPLALLLLHRNATVTICHSQTPDLANLTRQADLLAVAVGRPAFIQPEMVKPGAVVLDFGIHIVGEEQQGDVAPAVAEVAGALTPVPGGTGPVTTVMLMRNTLRAAELQMVDSSK